MIANCLLLLLLLLAYNCYIDRYCCYWRNYQRETISVNISVRRLQNNQRHHASKSASFTNTSVTQPSTTSVKHIERCNQALHH